MILQTALVRKNRTNKRQALQLLPYRQAKVKVYMDGESLSYAGFPWRTQLCMLNNLDQSFINR